MRKKANNASWVLAFVFVLAIAVVGGGGLTVYVPHVRKPPAVIETVGVVSRVIDGDTIEVTYDDGTVARVRYLTVDTPEVFFGVDCYGPESSAANKELVLGERVALERCVQDVDRYERLLRHVYLADGTWVNGWLVEQGYARVKVYPPDDCHADKLFVLQELAEGRDAGGWKACGW